TERDSPPGCAVGDERIASEDGQNQAGLTDQVGGRTSARELEALTAHTGARLAKPSSEEGSQIEEPNLFRVNNPGEQPVKVPRAPLRRRLCSLPAIALVRLPSPQNDSGYRCCEQGDGKSPVKREEKTGDRRQGDGVLQHLDEPVHDVRGPEGRFLERALEPVVVLRIFVVLQIGLDGLGMQKIVYVIGDRLRLSLADERGQC